MAASSWGAGKRHGDILFQRVTIVRVAGLGSYRSGNTRYINRADPNGLFVGVAHPWMIGPKWVMRIQQVITVA